MRLPSVFQKTGLSPHPDFRTCAAGGVERLLQARHITYPQERRLWEQTAHPYPEKELDYRGNVMNTLAEAFYRRHGVEQIAPAFEREAPAGVALMFCKHCIRYSLGWCPVYQKKAFALPRALLPGEQRRQAFPAGIRLQGVPDESVYGKMKNGNAD